MGYSFQGKVKTIVLPSPDTAMSVEEYKKEYKIDLKDIVDLSNGTIHVKNEILNTSMILVMQSKELGDIHPLTPVVKVYSSGTHNPGVSDAVANLCTLYNPDENDFYGISLTITRDVPYDFDHLSITTREF